MDSNSRATVMSVSLLVAVLLLGGFWWYAMTEPSPLSSSIQGATSTGTQQNTEGSETTSTAVSRVMLAFLDTAGNSNGTSRGCDKVIMVPWHIATTSAPLSGALKALFGISTTTVNGWFNFIDRTNETLKFDHATVLSGTANIYLTGSLSDLAGICDDPRTAIQIEETALQFSTVKEVQIYLNGSPTTLVPSEK